MTDELLTPGMSRQIYVHPNLVEIFSTENVRDSPVSGAPSLPAISRDTGGVGTCVPGKLRILSVLKANRRLVAYAQALRPGALAVDVNEQNVAGRSFYEALGFVVIVDHRSTTPDAPTQYCICVEMRLVVQKDRVLLSSSGLRL